MNEDLLTTNKLEDSNLKKLLSMKDKSNFIYDKNKPPFLENNSTNIKANLTEDYLIHKQMENLASLDKKKKIKKTSINIDSRNRQIRY